MVQKKSWSFPVEGEAHLSLEWGLVRRVAFYDFCDDVMILLNVVVFLSIATFLSCSIPSCKIMWQLAS